MTAAPILAAHRWNTNADLIADLHELGHLADVPTLDPTWGEGNWWTRWAPTYLIRHDLYKLDGVDFRHLPHGPGTFPQVAFDPPYVPIGSQETSTLPAFNAAYGRDTAPRTPAGVQQLINDGLDETWRVTTPGGVTIVKCQDYVWSARLWPGSHLTLAHAFGLGYQLVDRFEMITSPRPQPGNRTRKHQACRGRGCGECAEGRVPTRQHHARRNLSTLFVLRKPLQVRKSALTLFDVEPS